MIHDPPPDQARDTLPAGARLRDGAYLLEATLGKEETGFAYHAYDVPSRCVIAIHEFFPPGATRDCRQVLGPPGWTHQGFELAKAKFIQRQEDPLAVFEENGTAYVVTAATTSAAPAQKAAVLLEKHFLATGATDTKPSSAAEGPANQQQPYVESTSEEEVIASTHPPPNTAATRNRFTFSDLWPDAMRGAWQGGLLCGIGGIVLGALAANFGGGNVVSGATVGALAAPIGAVGGALVGSLRALPSTSAQLASASPRSARQQTQSTLAGAVKGALLGGSLGLAMLVANGTLTQVSVATSLQALLLFSLAGAIGGALVGFIRIDPRDRQRRK